MTQGATVRSSRGSSVVWIAVIAMIAAVFAVGFFSQDDDSDVGGFADPNGTGLEGLLGLRLFIEEAGGATMLDAGLPDESVDVAILATDSFSTFSFSGENLSGRDFVTSWVPLLEWVEGGGVLLTSLDVATGPELAFRSIDDDELAFPGTCTIAELESINEIRTLEYSPGTVEPGDMSCFGSDNEAFVVSRPVGEGQIIRLSTMAPLMNRSLDDADNGALAARLLGIGDAPVVSFLDGAPISFQPAEGVTPENVGDPESNGDQVLRDADGNPVPFSGGDIIPRDDEGNPVAAGNLTLWQLIETRVKVLFLGLIIAALLYVASVARRLGSPVIEPLPIELPSSSYVDAVGRLYARTPESIARSSQILRSDLRTDLGRRVGLSPDASALELATAIAGPDGRNELLRVLDGPTPTNDEEFVTLARELIEIRDRVERGGVATLAQRTTDSFAVERTPSV